MRTTCLGPRNTPGPGQEFLSQLSWSWKRDFEILVGRILLISPLWVMIWPLWGYPYPSFIVTAASHGYNFLHSPGASAAGDVGILFPDPARETVTGEIQEPRGQSQQKGLRRAMAVGYSLSSLFSLLSSLVLVLINLPWPWPWPCDLPWTPTSRRVIDQSWSLLSCLSSLDS